MTEAIVEAAEVPAPLAVHPAEISHRVGAHHAFRIGQRERAVMQPATALVELEVVLDVRDRHLAIGKQDVAVALRAHTIGPVEAHEEP